MEDEMVSSAELGFNLKALLEKLDQNELSKFKSLLKSFAQENELQELPQMEVDMADRKQLVEILVNHCPSYWVDIVVIQAFRHMNRRDLWMKAKSELREAALASLDKNNDKNEPPWIGIEWKEDPEYENLEEILQNLERQSESTEIQEEEVKNLGKTKRILEGEKPGKEDIYRSIMKKKFWKRWKDNWPGLSENIHDVTQRDKMLIPFCDPTMLRGPFPHTVVLHGPAGVGKTTLAKKLMLDWAENNLNQVFKYAFYLSCKELNHMGACSFAELIFKDWPEWQDDAAEVLAQAQKILFIIDGFEELRVPAGALIHDICGNWQREKPVPVLLGSLLKRKMLPKASLLVTTRPEALRELRLLVEQPLFIEMEGFLEPDRRAYLLRQFGDQDRALRALDLMRGNAALFRLGSAPAVCHIFCACLKLQMEKGEDPAPTCLTTTSLFLRFLCDQFTLAPGSCPSENLRGSLRALCLLAAQGVWTQTSVFDEEDLGKLEMEEEDLCPFLDKGVLQRDCDGCYSLIHLSVQQFLAAMYYILDSEEQEEAECHRGDIGDVQKLFSKEERVRNPSLTQVGYFLFGLSNEKRVQELESTFGCRMSQQIKEELLKYRANLDENKPFSRTDMKELLYCLYESQEEGLVRGAMAPFKELSLHLNNKMDIIDASFCLKHCQNLQKLSLRVAKGLFLEDDTASEPHTQLERSQDDQHILSFWTELCSIFGSNKNLTFLKISQSFLSTSSVRILCEQIASATCNLQKVVLKNISPADVYQSFCLTFSHNNTLTNLTLQGNDQDDTFPSLCEVLRHPKCNLQYLRLASCSATTQQWVNLFLALETSQSLMSLILSDNQLLDKGVKLLLTALKHPKCCLQRLSLENCHFTEACCKNLASVLIVNVRLTHLCLAKNNLGDRGVTILCEGLSYPECRLQILVLWHCNITTDGCHHLSKILQQKSSLTHLDLGLNHLGIAGLRFLCEALKAPLCNLKCL
ncbi:NACHT, LRR and PYD domains-containing protein 2 isoform X2 [Nycticebus coucang]|nr:NACHT, LRR and PYD domains-containing protein 2 isoform X2 [Nycticebus coucang]